MDQVFKPDSDSIRDKGSIIFMWIAGVSLTLAVVWGSVISKVSHDLQNLQREGEKRVQARASVYAEQVRRTVKEIDQISLTLKYQWQYGTVPLNLVDQYEKAMHRTPTYPVAIGANGRIKSSWRQASIGLDMSNIAFFAYHRDHDDTELRINPPSPGIGGMQGKRTLRFTRRVNDAKGNFIGIAMVSTEPTYLASLSESDALNEGDFISVRLIDGPLLVVKTVDNREHPDPYYIGIPSFESNEGIRKESGDKFIDQIPRYVAWKKIDGYPLVALATITENSAVRSYAPTRSAYLLFATVITALTLLVAVVGCTTQIRNTERRRKAERVRSTFRLAVDGAHEAFYMIDPLRAADGTIIDYVLQDCNERAAEMNRLPRQQLIGKRFSELFEASALDKLIDFFHRAHEEGFLEDEFFVGDNLRHMNGWFQRRAIRSGDGFAVTVRDISAAKRHEEMLGKLAITDTLTGLPNRRWLNDFLPGALSRARASRKRLALLFIDLDNFKKINDTMGHAAGDELLCAAAVCLQNAVRNIDHVARLGGDEFTVLIENLENDSDAEKVAEQILKSFAGSEIFARWTALNVKCSIGIAIYPSHAQAADRLLNCADEAMYEAKAAGKGCYRIFDRHFSSHKAETSE